MCLLKAKFWTEMLSYHEYDNKQKKKLIFLLKFAFNT